jgi:4-amino-4-deoxy-L-arabinose transferase-like glycosyltransferase
MMTLTDPIRLSLLSAALAAAVLVLVRPPSQDAAWIRSGVAYLAFMAANVLLALGRDPSWRYFLLSLAGSLLWLALAPLVVALGRLRWRYKGSGESAMVFLAVIYHPPLLGVAFLVRWLIA